MTHDTVRKTLIARRAELTRDLQKIEHDLDQPAPKDWEDAASERHDDEVLEALGTHDLAEVRAIDAAIARIDDGTYGTCAKCGDDISPERLEAVPTAALCRACA